MIIYTDKNKIAFIIDDDDYEIIKHYSWFMTEAGYIYTTVRKKLWSLHSLLGGRPTKGYCWDHLNRNKLDNRRDNLELVTIQENSDNRKPKPVKFPTRNKNGQLRKVRVKIKSKRG